MTALETRYPCPVCLGVKMEKIRLPAARVIEDAPSKGARGKGAGVRTAGAGAAGDLVLDHCQRCGGVWFEAGEVQQLRRTDATVLWKQIVQRDEIHAMQCRSCSAHIPRTESNCHACGWKFEIDCPECDRPMRVAEQGGMRIDYCTHCKGAWFDHDELTGIWRLEVDSLVKRRGSRTLDAAGDIVLLDVLLYDPFIAWYGINALGHVAGGAAQAISGSGALDAAGAVGAGAGGGIADAAGAAAGAAAEAAGAAGEVAAGLFETVAEIIAGIFG